MPKILVWDWNGDDKTGIPKTRIIVIRGTHSLQEWKDNFDCEEIDGTKLNIKGHFHKNFAETRLRMWNELEKDITGSDLPIVITGHSREYIKSEFFDFEFLKRIKGINLMIGAPIQTALSQNYEEVALYLWDLIDGQKKLKLLQYLIHLE